VQRYALSAIGRDRPGIVAAIAAVLLEHGLNIEDSQATILRGHFSIVLIVAARDELDRQRLDADIQRVAAFLELEAVSFTGVADAEDEGPEPSHMVAVYGVDHPGIVHAAARALAEQRVDITDLNTRLLEDEEGREEPLYALMMEVAVPPEVSPGQLRETLDSVGRDEGVEVTLHELERDEL
jgi:glycine cleavage system transcriptional repressor